MNCNKCEHKGKLVGSNKLYCTYFEGFVRTGTRKSEIKINCDDLEYREMKEKEWYANHPNIEKNYWTGEGLYFPTDDPTF